MQRRQTSRSSDIDQDQTAGSSQVDVRLDSQTSETSARTACLADWTKHARHTGLPRPFI